MELNRREFLALTGSAVAVRLDARLDSVRASGPVLVLHLEDDYCLPESIEGYRRALADIDVRFITASPNSANECARTLSEQASHGTTVLVESALTSPSLLSELGVHAAATLNLWRGGFSPAIPDAHRVPYVEYAWPISAMVRDFTRVVPMSATGWHAIAHVDGICVGLTRRVDRGRIVLLGSPLGPVLRAGDREAHEWLAALIDVTARPGSAPRFQRTVPAVPGTAGVRNRA